MSALRIAPLDRASREFCEALAARLKAVRPPAGDYAVLVAGHVDTAMLGYIGGELGCTGAASRSRTLLVYAEGDPSMLRALLALGVGDVVPRDDQVHDVVAARLLRWACVDAALVAPAIAMRLVGDCEAWRSTLRAVAESALFSQAPLLLTGPTGTGKDLLARMLHTLDPRAHKRDLVVVDCTTLSRELSGSELFGHERGAFTGAAGERDGAVALADGGTLFLDEIGELPLEQQGQLLRVLQERACRRVGGTAWRRVDFRLVCATNRDLEAEVAGGRFRVDLYHRVAALVCRTPSLSERREDIPALVRHFVDRSDGSMPRPRVSPSLMDYLVERAYPGNVRELLQLVLACLRRYAGAGALTLGCCPEEEMRRWQAAPPSAPQGWHSLYVDAFVREALRAGVGLKELGRLVEAAAVRIAVEDADSVTTAARRLGVTARALHHRRAAEKGGPSH